jgi:hypothetical protein
MSGTISSLSQCAIMAWCLVKHRDNSTFFFYCRGVLTVTVGTLNIQTWVLLHHTSVHESEVCTVSLHESDFIQINGTSEHKINAVIWNKVTSNNKTLLNVRLLLRKPRNADSSNRSGEIRLRNDRRSPVTAPPPPQRVSSPTDANVLWLIIVIPARF